MDSSRLPGKVLLPILGKPIIWHIYQRLKFSEKIDKICISTSNEKSDAPIVKFAKENNIDCFQGSKENLVSRHLGAAKKFNADVIIRITADCPLIDPKIIDDLINLYQKNLDIDFLSNTKVRTFPIGLDVEIIPTRTLEKILPISEHPDFYEYFISMYIYEHPEEFTSLGISLDKPNLLRWTLDYMEDYEFIKQIYSNLYKENAIFGMNDIIKLLEKHPELVKINSMHNSQFSHLKYHREKNHAK